MPERAIIPKPISFGLMLSYRCSASCRHCMYACGTDWPADYPTSRELSAILEVIAPYIAPAPGGSDCVGINYGLHFTGGEPFLNYPLLEEGLEAAAELEIPSVFIETNGFWASDDDTVRERLSDLKQAGLKGIMISVNPFYLEHVPFERTRRLIKYSVEMFGPNTMVYQTEYYRRYLSEGITGKKSFAESLEEYGPKGFRSRTEFFLNGRAPYALEDTGIFPHYPAEDLFAVPCMPAFLRSWHNHVDNYGNFIPGYCGGLSLGSITDLPSLVEDGLLLADRPVLWFIIRDDFAGLLRFAESEGYRRNPKGYLSKCHLCADIRLHLVRTDSFPELEPERFYSELTSGATGPSARRGPTGQYGSPPA